LSDPPLWCNCQQPSFSRWAVTAKCRWLSNDTEGHKEPMSRGCWETHTPEWIWNRHLESVSCFLLVSGPERKD
jgi:hypothetical protein